MANASATILKQGTSEMLLRIIIEEEGFAGLDELLEECVSDSVCPCICRICHAIDGMEPDQEEGYCEECGGDTMVSALILAEVI